MSFLAGLGIPLFQFATAGVIQFFGGVHYLCSLKANVKDMGASFGSQASFITSSPQPCLKVQGKCRHPVGWRGKHCLMGTYYPCLLAPSEMAGQDGVIISHNVLCRGPGLDVWNKMLAQPPHYTSQESPVYPVKFAFVFRSGFWSSHPQPAQDLYFLESVRQWRFLCLF